MGLPRCGDVTPASPKPERKEKKNSKTMIETKWLPLSFYAANGGF